jgi:outer membrane protein OmpA-like peptidoglycan-associated protein
MMAAMVALGAAMSAHAQTATYTGAPWRFGLFGGLNFNIVGAGAQALAAIPGDNFAQSNDIIDGTALGYYAGLMTEYNPGALFGFQLRAGLDDRRVNFNDWDVVGSSRTRFSARMTYISVEPLLRVNLGSPNFHLTAGPLLSFNIAAKYDWVPRDETSPNIVDQPIDNVNKFAYGVSGGLGYDILLNSKSASTTKWYLTPFAEASYMMDQRQNSFPGQDRNDTWVTTSIRGGFQLKVGAAPAAPAPIVSPAVEEPTVDLSLRTPNAVTDQRSLIEFFPLRNYLFFNDGSTTLPNKYVTLDNNSAAQFHESNLMQNPGTGGTSTSTSTMDRSQRQMNVYYNALNIFGDRLRNSTSSITLVGSAPSQAEGLEMANNIKTYITSTFGIDPSRIATKGQVRAPHASGTRVTPPEDLNLVAEENRRVEVLSDDINLLKPVRIESTQIEPIDNDLVVTVNPSAPIADYTVTITGSGFTQTYGPFQSTTQRIDARPIMMTNNSGTYTATVTARTADNRTITKSTNFSLTRATNPPTTGTRYSILFEYDESKTVQTYDQFLRQTVAPQIPNNATVVVHGHTDKIGLEDYNFELSTKRAAEAVNILKDEMSKAGKTVNFDSYGFGENEERAPFANGSPEGRYYNRTVLIEIIPGS